jgi:hypothetical protein
MSGRPRTRAEGLLAAICAQVGFCDTGLRSEDFREGLSADEITDMIVHGEGFDPVMMRNELRQQVRAIVVDWWFKQDGPGARSGLPR